MKVKKAIRKIVALGVGASMMGATLLGATAADLADFPSPFVKDGMFDGMMVVGDDAAPADIIGVTDIAMSLQFSSSVTRTVNIAGASGVSLSGDAAEIGEPNDLLELYEQLGNVKETFTDADLEALQSGVVSTDQGTTDYNQYLRLEDNPTTGFPTTASSNYVVYSENEDEEVSDFLFFADGEVMFEYELEFEEGFESDVVDNNGDAASCGDLEDLEDEVIHMMGSNFAVINAEVADGESDASCANSTESVTLELMAGDVTDTLEEGETKTYNIDGKDYEVTLIIVSDATLESKFKINGEVTDELSDGDTDVLNDGTEIGIRSILPNEAGETAGGDIVEFYLGASKMTLTDPNIGDEDFSASTTVEINEENIEAAQLVIKAGPAGGGDYRINSIKYRLEADASAGDLYVPPGHGVREYLDEPEGMLALGWDIRYEGLMETGTTEIKLDPSGDDEYRLRWTNLQGQEYTFTILEQSTTGTVIGQDKGADGSDGGAAAAVNATGHYSNTVNEDDLWIYDDDHLIAEDDYFTLTESGASAGVADERSFSNLLQFESIDTDSQVVTFSDLSGGQKTSTYALDSASNLTGELIVAGNTFAFRVISDGETAAATGEHTAGASTFSTSALAVIDVDQDGDGALTGAEAGVKFVAEGGAIMDFSATNLTGCTGEHSLLITTLGGEFDEGSDGAGTLTANDGDESIHLCIDTDTTSGEVDANVAAYWDNTTTATLDLHQVADNDDLEQGMSAYGVFIKELDDANDAATITIEYPLTQRGAQVFITAGETASASSGSGGSLTYEEPVRIEIGSAMLASKVADPTSTNVISVGGSCINSVTASLLGLSYPACGEASGLSEGEAVLKLVESGSNVAIVVAGWNADDTTRATRVLADYGKWQDAGKLTGSEVKVTGTSLTNFDVTPAE